MNKTLALLFALILSCVGPQSTLDTTSQLERAVSWAQANTYLLLTPRGSCSAFQMEGRLITAAHCVYRQNILTSHAIVVDQLGAIELVQVIAVNPDLDWAVLKPSQAKYGLTRAQVPPGTHDPVFAVGHPHGGPIEVSPGVVATPQAFVVEPAAGFVRITPSLEPGNSGGPCLDANGRVFGLASYRFLIEQFGTVCAPLPPSATQK